MKIERIELYGVKVPLPAPFRPSWIPGFAQTENRFDLLCLRTASGIEGWTAAPAMGRERAGLGALLGPYFLGERADDLLSVRQRIREMGYLGWRVGWIEAACWDIIGKARSKPVWELLGGTGGAVRLYASTGEVRSGEYRVDEIKARMEDGFTAVKLRVHDATLEQDVAQITRAREGVGGDVILGVDANQGWRVAVIADAPRWDYDRALAFCRAAEDAGYLWVEEPLPMDAYDDLARLTAATRVNISGGELNGGGLPEYRTILGKRCFDWIQPDAVFAGGITETWGIMRHARAAGIKYSPHTWTNGIGFAINLQLVGASPFREHTLLEYPLDPPGWVPEGRDGVLTEPWHHDKGTLQLPTRPGLGFEIDHAALRAFGKRMFKLNKLRVAVSAVMDRGVAEAKALGATRDARLAARHATLAGEGDTIARALAAVDAPQPPEEPPSRATPAPPARG